MRVFLVNFVSWSQGHAGNVGHVVFFETFRPTIGHRVTGSRWSRGSRGFFLGKILFLGHRVTWITLCVFGKFCFWDTWSRCAFLETQNWVTFVTRATSITSVTIVHGSQGHAVFFFPQETRFLGSRVHATHVGHNWHFFALS